MLDHCTLCAHHCQPVFLSFFRLSDVNSRFLAFSRVFEVLLAKNLKIIQKAGTRICFRPAKKRAVPAPTSEPLCKVKLFGARCTIFHAISYTAKKSAPIARNALCRLLCVRRIFDYSKILVTTPEPTVRPPSRIAKRSFSSMAIGVIRVHSMSTLSPGMTISTPSGSLMLPVTSVVRK